MLVEMRTKRGSNRSRACLSGRQFGWRDVRSVARDKSLGVEWRSEQEEAPIHKLESKKLGSTLKVRADERSGRGIARRDKDVTESFTNSDITSLHNGNLVHLFITANSRVIIYIFQTDMFQL